MQKTLSQVNDCPQRDRTESEWYEGVQTFMWMTEYNIVEVPFDKEHLLEVILSPRNLNKAYKAVVRNEGCGGVDNMSCEQLFPWLRSHKDELICSLLDGSYRPNPVLRVEIPKDNGKMRQLGIPTVVDRLVQQAINQVLTPKQPFDEIKHRHTLKEVGDVAKGAYDWIIERSNNDRLTK